MNLDVLKAELLRERDEMLRRARTPIYTIKGDEADLAVMLRIKEQTLWLTSDAQMRLEEIERALERIERGTYGACARCGISIPEERLNTMPFTLHCVRCQTQIERRRAK